MGRKVELIIVRPINNKALINKTRIKNVKMVSFYLIAYVKLFY